MEHRARFESAALGQVHHHLHADRPFPLVVAVGQAEVLVERLAHRADRTVADDRQSGADIHAGHEAGGGRAVPVRPLVRQPDADDPVSFDAAAR